jgi:asparagine synthase (glutamine-hydrolysing)
MCGICGIFATADSFDTSAGTLDAMRDLLEHRGPDDAGSWRSPSGRVALGHRRLSIVDLSPAGRNPMPNEDGSLWITYNGEVYNHRALREELERKGHVYRSRTDTETILHLYEEEGPACVERLQGMFAFAIWDEGRAELFLARDRLGIKPLYYVECPGGIVFGSEIKALLRHPAVSAELDLESFFHYLTFVCTPAPRTMFEGISKLRPAERMTISADGRIRSELYWSPFSVHARAEVAEASEPELEKRLIDLLRESIRKRMMADVPFGVFLSGGVDSSTNVALMAELIDEPIRTFSIGFAGHDEFNEFDHARTVARAFGTDHHEIEIDWTDAASFLPDLVYHQDEPIADYTCVPVHYLARLARETGTVVVQVGEGADELFHGYEHYIDHVRFQREWWPRIQRVPAPIRLTASRTLAGVSSRVGRGATRLRFVDDAARGRQAFWGGAISFTGALKEQVLADGIHSPDAYEVVERLWREAEHAQPDADLLQKMTYVELKQRLAELLLMRVDKMTMASSVEARVPFLDHELVEFVVALPERMKVRDGTGKYLLKKAVEPLLPREIVYRRKQGFYPPMASWFRGELGERAHRETRASALAARNLLDYSQIDRLWAAHRRGAADWSFQLWNLWNVSAWYDYWVAGRS